MAKFILILREDPTVFSRMSPADLQAAIQEYGAWAAKIGSEGRLLGGHKLANDGGRRLHAAGGTVTVTDGPYAEAKDVIGGFFLIGAADYDDAQALAAQCPHLKYGGEVEVRQIDEMD